jgi:AcrR family transcriptional regulator
MAAPPKRPGCDATKRLTGAERKRQIVEVILGLVSEYGVQGVTLARIAAGAGVTQAALYMHFSSRDEMLRAAVDVLYERVADVIASSDDPDVMVRLRNIGGFHSGLVSSGTSSFIHPLFEFLAAPPETGLREMLGEKQRQIIEGFAAIVEEGRNQGTVRADVDSPRSLLGRRRFAPHGLDRVRDFRQIRDHAGPSLGEHCCGLSLHRVS